MEKFLKENIKERNFADCYSKSSADLKLVEEQNPTSTFQIVNPDSIEISLLKVDGCLISRNGRVYYNRNNLSLKRKCDYVFSILNKISFIELKPDSNKKEEWALDDYFNAVDQIIQTVQYFQFSCLNNGNKLDTYFPSINAFISMGTDVTQIDESKRTAQYNTLEEKYITVSQNKKLPEVKTSITI